MIIRKAIPADAEFIANYLLLAMEDIVYTFIGEKNAQKAKQFLLYFTARENNQYSYQNCWVAVIDEQVVAAVVIYDGARLKELREPVVAYIRKGFPKDWNPDDETTAGEYYIDSFGVHPNRQGKGVGATMLQFLINEYATKHGLTLGLLVDEENPNAKRLYVKWGFKRVGQKIVFGKKMEHLQYKGG